jgi:TRAP-type mannitol/chloroaromatic compound transport system substrate-binding protein
MKRSYLIPLVISLACFLIFCGFPSVAVSQPKGQQPAASGAHVIHWQLQTPWGPKMLLFRSASDLCQTIKEMSNGQLDIKLLPVNAVAPPLQLFDACSKGVVEAFFGFPGFWAGKVPEATFLGAVPFGFNSPLQYDIWYWNLGGIQIARESYAKHNLHFVGYVHSHGAPSDLYTRKDFPLRKFEDFKGKKMRYAPGISSEVMKEAGVSVVNLPPTEFYTSLEKGVIDGGDFFARESNFDMGIHEVTRWIIVMPSYKPAACLELAVNMDAWKKLPPHLKAIVESAVREYSGIFHQRFSLADLEALERMLKSGMQVIQMPPAEEAKFRSRAMTIWKSWANKSPLASKAYESQVAYMKRLGLIQ